MNHWKDSRKFRKNALFFLTKLIFIRVTAINAHKITKKY